MGYYGYERARLEQRDPTCGSPDPACLRAGYPATRPAPRVAAELRGHWRASGGSPSVAEGEKAGRTGSAVWFVGSSRGGRRRLFSTTRSGSLGKNQLHRNAGARPRGSRHGRGDPGPPGAISRRSGVANLFQSAFAKRVSQRGRLGRSWLRRDGPERVGFRGAGQRCHRGRRADAGQSRAASRWRSRIPSPGP